MILFCLLGDTFPQSARHKGKGYLSWFFVLVIFFLLFCRFLVGSCWVGVSSVQLGFTGWFFVGVLLVAVFIVGEVFYE